MCMALSLTMVVGAAVHAEEIAQNFRGQRVDLKLFRLTGANLAKAIHSEAQGLRITLLPDRPNTLPVGLIARTGLHGDFEITVSFDVLRIDRPKEGRGAGLSIWITQRTPTQDAATIAWLLNTEGERTFIANQASTKPDGEREYHGVAPLPTKASSGKLRLTREDGQLTYAIAEGSSKDFRELYQTDWSDADIDQIRIAADGGSSHALVDVRLQEIQIHADELGSARVVVKPKSRWPFWLGMSAVAGLVIAGGIWFWRR